MFCKNCGHKMDDDARFCPNCGTDMKPEAANTSSNANSTYTAPNATPNPYPYQPGIAPRSNTLAIVGFILSFFTAIVGLVCSIIAYKNSDQYDVPYKGFATAGIIISSVSTALAVIAIGSASCIVAQVGLYL